MDDFYFTLLSERDFYFTGMFFCGKIFFYETIFGDSIGFLSTGIVSDILGDFFGESRREFCSLGLGTLGLWDFLLSTF